MEIDYKLPFLTFSSCFLLIIALFWKISPQLKKSFDQNSPDIILFFTLACVSLLVIWIYLFKFFFLSYTIWSFSKGFHWEFSLNAISHWLHDTPFIENLFKQTSIGNWQWLWTHQLGTFATTVWIPILAIEGWRRRIPHLWAYLLLGELVGISCASSLFFAVMISHPPLRKRVPSKLLITLALSVITGLISVMVSPNIAVYSKRLILNLLTIHIILYLPLLFDFSESSEFTVYNGTPKVVALIYSLTAGANISIYLQEWAKCLLTLDQSKCMLCDIYSTLFTTFFEHPAQTTIGSDVIFVNMAGIAWMWSHSQLVWKKHIPNWAWLCMFTTPILSASVTLPIFFAACEGTKLIVDQKKHE